MFEAHQWDVPGNKLMTSAPALIVKHYGSVQAFEIAHRSKPVAARDVWDRGYSVLFTSYWGWTPETWGAVGWTGDQGLTRRTNLLEKLTDPFITVSYVTGNKSYIDPDLKGKIAGFFLVSHQTGDRFDFTHPIHHNEEPDKWRHSLKAIRAFSYLPEYRLSVSDLDPLMKSRARSISSQGEILTSPKHIDILRNTPWLEVDVYNPSFETHSVQGYGFSGEGLVRAGPANSEGYVVSAGTQFLPRELYIMRLGGDAAAFIGRPTNRKSIVKIGLSASPELRRQTIQKSMPRGAFEWKITHTSSSRGFPKCPNHTVAVKGEDAMKYYLASHAEWLGGEFYLASDADIDQAWHLGCQAALAESE